MYFVSKVYIVSKVGKCTLYEDMCTYFVSKAGEYTLFQRKVNIHCYKGM